MKFFTILFVVLFIATPSQAYVPRAKTIIKKMSRNNGKDTYKLVREVTLQSPSNLVKAKETWTVANGDKMKVHVESLNPENPWTFEISYDKGKRQTLSTGNKVKTFPKSPEFFEPLFHDRSSRSLTNRMVSYRFIPDWIQDTPDPDYDNGKTQMTEEPFVRLAPIEGSVSYALGANKNASGDNNRTTLWIEQDSFLIKKGRLRSKAEFVNSVFQTYTGGLKLPTEQTISWGDSSAQIKILAVDALSSKEASLDLNAKQSGNIPSDPLIKEFYSRFR